MPAQQSMSCHNLLFQKEHQGLHLKTATFQQMEVRAFRERNNRDCAIRTTNCRIALRCCSPIACVAKSIISSFELSLSKSDIIRSPMSLVTIHAGTSGLMIMTLPLRRNRCSVSGDNRFMANYPSNRTTNRIFRHLRHTHRKCRICLHR